MADYYTYDPEFKVIVSPGGGVRCRTLSAAADELNRLRRFIQYVADVGSYEDWVEVNAERVLVGEDFQP